MPELTYGRSAEYSVLTALGLDVDEWGHVVYDDGEYVETVCGKDSLRIDEVGGFAHEEDAKSDTLLVCDNFSCIVEWESERDIRDDETDD